MKKYGAFIRTFVAMVMMFTVVSSLAVNPSSTLAAGIPYSQGDVFAGVGQGKIKHF